MPKEGKGPKPKAGSARPSLRDSELCTCDLCIPYTSEQGNRRVRGLFLTRQKWLLHQDPIYQATETSRLAASGPTLSRRGSRASITHGSSHHNAAVGSPTAPESRGPSHTSENVDAPRDAPQYEPAQDATQDEHPQDAPQYEPARPPSPSPATVALDDFTGQLDALRRSWKHPNLWFVGPFEPMATDKPITNVTKYLRHNDHPENKRYLNARDAAIVLQRAITAFDLGAEMFENDVEQRHTELVKSVDAWVLQVEQAAIYQWHDFAYRLKLYQEAGIDYVETSSHFHKFPGIPAHQLLGMLLVLVLHLLRGLTRSSCHFLLEAIGLLFFQVIASVSERHRLDTSFLAAGIDLGWNIDIRTVLDFFDLHPKVKLFAVCGRCSSLYPPDPRHDGFTEKCVRAGCNGRIVRRQGPVLQYNYQSPISWIGRLLARPGIMSSLITVPTPAFHVDGLVQDFWSATAVRDFKDRNGTSPFFPPQPIPGELRLAFGLFVDWFTPFKSRNSRHYSVGAIYLVCMNLPPDLRYKVENICLVGVIPGPKEPRKQNLHHFLCPLVDDLLRLWSPGIVLSRTANAAEVLVRGVLMPFVADAPALRKAVGMKSYSSTVAPCSLCKLTKKEINNNFDIRTWPRRTAEYHREHAYRWRDADEKGRKKIANETGIRWSELLRLPYWDPTKYAVIDAMHNLFLAALCRHLSIIWGMKWKSSRSRDSPGLDDEDVDSNYGDPSYTGGKSRKIYTPAQQTACFNDLASRIQQLGSLGTFRKDFLQAMAIFNDVPLSEGDTKADIVEALRKWRISAPNSPVKVPPAHPYDVDMYELEEEPASNADHILTNAELQWIWELAALVQLPTWVDRGPKRFGRSGQGHIKADQWRTIATILLPLVLIPQWSAGGERQDPGRRAMLTNFLDLVAAVNLITSKSVTARRIERMGDHLRMYCLGVRALFQNYKIPPSLHQSFHLPELLHLFGPVTSFWGFPFERFNGIMHNFNHNGRRGLLEQSLFWSFCRASYLRHVMEKLAESSLLLSFCQLFDRVFGYNNVALALALFSASTDALASDEASKLKPKEAAKTPTNLTDDALGALAACLNVGLAQERYTSRGGEIGGRIIISPSVIQRPYFTRNGIKYADHVSSRKDFHVMAHTDLNAEPTAGRIAEIFDHTHPVDDGSLVTETFVVFQPYVPLSATEELLEPFHPYPDLGAKSYHTYVGHAFMIKAEDIVGHFASLEYEWKLEGGRPYRLLATVSLARD